MQETLASSLDRRLASHRIGAAAIGLALVALGVAPVRAQEASPAASAILECTAAAPGGAVPATPSAAPERESAATPVEGELTVFAAASLRNAFEAFEPMYEAATGLDLVYSFDASSFLRTQIEEGAPADVFASADTVNTQALLDAALATDPVAFACNQLTVIVPAANPAAIDSIDDLVAPGVRIVAAAEEVPITRYATQLVENLGIAEGYAANVASEEDNVAAVRAKIELGEGDAAIVYATDALAAGDTVTEIDVPPDANVPTTYAAVAVAGTDQPEASRAFLDWLVGLDGQAALAGFGFLPAPEAP